MELDPPFNKKLWNKITKRFNFSDIVASESLAL